MLLHRGEHRHSSATDRCIGETADSQVLRDTHAQDLRRMQHTRSTVVIDTEESIGLVVRLQDKGRIHNCLHARIALHYPILACRQTIVLKRIAPTLVTTARDLQLLGGRQAHHTLATRLEQVLHRIISTHIVIRHHLVTLERGAWAVVQNERNTTIQHLLQMLQIACLLAHTHQYARYAGTNQRMNGLYLLLHIFARLANDDMIARLISSLLYTI